MSEYDSAIDDRALTQSWHTLGLEDRTVEIARTVTMRDDPSAEANAPAEWLQKLPRLIDGSGRRTWPELRLKEHLGEGGMGLVRLAEQVSLGREVAVKTVRPEARSQRSTMVLLREGWTTGLLEHPNIVPVYTLGRDDDGEPVIVMKRIEGTSWLEIIDNPECAPAAFDASDPEALHIEILIQICNAIHYAHSRRIIHRDLKPENIMLGEFGEVYVLDWGIAVTLEEDPKGRLTCAKNVRKPAETPAYMAPEMVGNEGPPLSHYTDVFLLGAMLYEALQGHPPYSGSTLFAILLRAHDCDPPPLKDSVPSKLRRICRRAMARDPDQRYADAQALRDALIDYRQHRQAGRLCAQGQSRLDEVQSLIADESAGEDIDETTLYRLFGECRFAYEQSIEIDPDYEAAIQGLQCALEVMADRSLKRNAHKAASLLISDFPNPNPEFTQRLDQVEQTLAQRQEEFEQLQQIRRDVDVAVGARARALFFFIMGSIWTVFALAFALVKQFTAFEPTPPMLFVHIVAVTAILGGLILFGRHRFIKNEAGRRMLLSVFVAFLFVTIYRAICGLLGFSTEWVFTFEMLIYGMVAGILAIAFERHIFWVAVPWTVGSIASALWPAFLPWLFFTANVLTMLILMWLWWPRKSTQQNAQANP